MTQIKRLARIILISTALVINLPFVLLLWVWVRWQVRSRIYYPGSSIPFSGTAVVLGAGLQIDGSPTPILYDRVATAVELYKLGIVKRLLMSGGIPSERYNEPNAMQAQAISMGVQPEDILLDTSGVRTYDSIINAKEHFKLEKIAVVTQGFHLNRALYICSRIGINAIGVVADRQKYRRSIYLRLLIREAAALVNSWLEINLRRPLP